MTDILSLNCLFIGDKLHRVLPAKLASKETVGDPQKAIKNKTQSVLHGVDARRLELYSELYV